MSRNTIIFTLLIPLVVILFVFDLLSGDTTLSAGQVWNVFTGNETDETTRNIVLSIRLVRVIVAILIGVALSISGLQMQTVFRNPLADPYLLGVSSGSGLGVAFFILGATLLGLAHSGFWAVRGNCRGRMGWRCYGVATDSNHQSLREKYSRCVDHGSNDRLHRGSHHTDFTILKFSGTTENVFPMVDGLPRTRYNHETSYHDSCDLRGNHTRNLLYQSIESFVVGRKLCSNHGIKYSTSPDSHFHIDDITHRNCNRLLRSR